MCSHYQAIKERERFYREFGVEPPDEEGKYDVWPGYMASAIRRPQHWDVGDEAVPPRESFAGRFGLIPHWATDPTFGHGTTAFAKFWKKDLADVLQSAPHLGN